MRQFKVINQLQLIDSVLMCKKPSGRSFQKAHYRQGDLDEACGAYSIAMVLNILGVFEADNIYSDSNSGDNRNYRAPNNDETLSTTFAARLDAVAAKRRKVGDFQSTVISTLRSKRAINAFILATRGPNAIFFSLRLNRPLFILIAREYCKP